MSGKDTDTTIKRLLDKSQEAFVLGIELYNRPTIRYHVEGCSFFLCNAWELLLKAKIIEENGLSAIYYPQKASRTITLSDCVKRVFTNKKDPLRINLEKIIDLRNTSTHFVTDEYETIYGPLLQSNVSEYDKSLRKFFGIEISERIPENYLILSIKRNPFDFDKARAVYDPDVFQKMLDSYSSVYGGIESDRYAARYETSLVVVKNPANADIAVTFSKDAGATLAVAKELKNPTTQYPFTSKNALAQINRQLKKRGIKVSYRGLVKDSFTSFHWTEFVKFYQMKNNSLYSYDRSTERERNSSFIYSQKAVDLVVDEVTKDPDHVIDKIVKRNRSQTAELSSD